MSKSKSPLVRFVLKPLAWIVGILLILVLLLLVFLNPIAKTLVESLGPAIAGVDITVDSLNLSPLQGRAEIRNLIIKNPADKGYASPHAIKLGLVNVDIDPMTALRPKIVVEEVTLKDIDINYESDLLLNSNLQDIIDNINRLSTEAQSSDEPAAEVRLQIDSFVMNNVGVYLYTKGMKTVPGVGLPVTIDPIGPVGNDDKGVTPFTFALQVMSTILLDSSKQLGLKIGDGAYDAASSLISGGVDLTGTATDALQQAGSSLVDSILPVGNKEKQAAPPAEK